MTKNTYPTLADYVWRVTNNLAVSGGYLTRGNVDKRSDAPLVSIVTVTFNAAKTLPRTLKSVREQTYPNIEHIIIDGGSSDGTLELIKSNEDSIALWRSEPDQGIYDAFNKGIALASGDFIGILNADDYYEADQVEKAVAALLRTGVPFVHGDIVLHGWQGQDVELLGDPHYESKIRERMPSLHQVTTLCRRDVFEKYGLFSMRYRIAGDFDWYLRLARHGCIGIHDPRVRAHMTAGGVSTTQQRRSLWEALLITWRHGLTLPRAIRSTLPRLIFPNGTPYHILRVLHVVNRPAAILSIVKRRLMNRRSSVDQALSGKDRTRPILSAFIDARQICLAIDPMGLEWIYGVGLRARTFANLSCDAEAQAVQLLLESGGAASCKELEHADVLILDQTHAKNLDIAHYIKNKTLLITSSTNCSPSDDYPFPTLNFGGASGYGVLINPSLTLRD